MNPRELPDRRRRKFEGRAAPGAKIISPAVDLSHQAPPDKYLGQDQVGHPAQPGRQDIDLPRRNVRLSGREGRYRAAGLSLTM